MYKMRRSIVLLGFLITVVHVAFSCSCIYIPTFCETISYGGGPIDSNYVIIHARVDSKNNDEMHVRVLTILHGTPDGNVLTIPQGYGADCRASIDGFEKNKEYIFALRGNSSSYFLSICGVTSLRVSGKDIIGDIAPGVHRIPIAEFPTIDNCGNIGSLLAFIDVTPTLTANRFEVSTTQNINDIRITVYDMLGRRMIQPYTGYLYVSEPFTIQANHFLPGSYVVVTEVAGIRRVFRVVIIS